MLSAAGYEGRLVADEGGYGPRLTSNRQAVGFIVEAIESAGLAPGRDVAVALDVASTHFFDGTHYRLAATGQLWLSGGQMIDQLSELIDAFPIISIEDGLAEDDWEGWQQLTARLGGACNWWGMICSRRIPSGWPAELNWGWPTACW